MANIIENIQTVVGGHFTPASLGPGLHLEVLNHVRANGAAYLRQFEEMYLGPAFDAVAQSRLYLPLLLQLLQAGDAAGVALTARRLLRQYDAVLLLYDAANDRGALLRLVPEETANIVHRLESRRVELRELIPVGP